MRQSLVIRLILLVVCLAAAGVYLAPSFVSGLWFLPENGIRLGLDLQGGSHLVLEVEVQKAVENRLRRVRSVLRDELRDRGIAFKGLDISPSGELIVTTAQGNMERIRDLLTTEFTQLEVSAASPAEVRAVFESRELENIRNFAVDQTLETIRNRIDQFGVTEPTIQRQGQYDILVQLARHPGSGARQGAHRQDRAAGVQARGRAGGRGGGRAFRSAARTRGAVRLR